MPYRYRPIAGVQHRRVVLTPKLFSTATVRKMIKTYFREFTSGRLQRLPFLGYGLLLSVLFFAFMFSSIAMIAGIEHAMGGNFLAAQENIRRTLTLPYLIILAVFMAVLMVAGLNLMAKRARDTGLPGWVFVVVLLVVTALVSWLISPRASQFISTIATLGLLFIPGDTFNRHKN